MQILYFCPVFSSWFFPRLISAFADWMSLYFHSWCGLSANSVKCAAHGLLKIQDAKIRHLCTIVQLCWAISSEPRHVSSIRKNLLNSSISCTCPHNMVNLGPLATEIGWQVWNTPANFNGFLVLASLLHRRCSMEVNQTLHNVWLSPG